MKKISRPDFKAKYVKTEPLSSLSSGTLEASLVVPAIKSGSPTMPLRCLRGQVVLVRKAEDVLVIQTNIINMTESPRVYPSESSCHGSPL